MNDFRHSIYQGKPGDIVPLVRKLDMTCPLEFFAKLSDYGQKKHSCLLESRDYLASDGSNELTFGTADPALYLTGKGNEFRIEALNKTGRRMVQFLACDESRFDFCESVEFTDELITGTVPEMPEVIDEESRLKTTNQMDVLRAVAFAFKLAYKPFRVTCGLIGALSYDFVDQFETLPANESDELENPDYELYFADHMFLMDHATGEGYVIVNALITDDDPHGVIEDAQKCFSYYTEAAEREINVGKSGGDAEAERASDTSEGEYTDMVAKAREHIIDGDIFQVVLSKTISQTCHDLPLDVYRRLRKQNPSPYMFYLNTGNTVLLGASPELNLRVSGSKPFNVEIRPIAGTRPRGMANGRIDAETDARYEAELKLDEKELAEHMMLVDLARNDIARVAQPGTRLVNEMLVTEKYQSVMHLVSNVRGVLREDLDALSAYLATMNMGTLTGAPKIEAMKIIRELEKNKRGYYGGAVMYLTVDGQFDSCITIRSMQIKDGKAYVRAGAGIVHDSVPKNEFAETEHKSRSCLRAVESGRAVQEVTK
ncbi:Anthranilate synthase component 1 [Anaerohalosphaera lusitana]|uniref:Anthranilate synthase component 1 n=1 Tax=Anaerohalosphaera lusitana TaxID=1936003 RepID=A0A1U9NKW0_9BACT|nr:anthranilate synthase component 1 [Anaerohalosphaera lusitana]AQT68582.1 Anthranilate synthase component 1 [Anaerohalosphaera lusitana]